MLSTKMLSFKLAMLLPLTVPSRCSELETCALDGFTLRGLYSIWQPLLKLLKSCFHLRFNEEPDLCSCACLEEYEGRTSIYRVSPTDQANLLFLSLIRPFKPISSSTIARWVKEVLSLSGIDTTKFKAHSTRGASATAATDRGVSISEILQLGDWSQESNFQKFYYRLNLTLQVAEPFCPVVWIRIGIYSFKHALLNLVSYFLYNLYYTAGRKRPLYNPKLSSNTCG